MINHEYVVQYGFSIRQDNGDLSWDDDGNWKFRFDPEDAEEASLARAAATATALYCAYVDAEGETDPDLILPHRVVHRITSDEAL